MLGRFAIWLVFCVFSACGWISAQPMRILAIGDSLTEEYRFETPFSGPKVGDSDIPAIDANTHNWPEIISEHRAEYLSFGSYKPNLLDYRDFRNAGYKYNYGVPGITMEAWSDIVTGQYSNFSGAEAILAYRTNEVLTDHLEEDGIGVVVIFLGGNDLNSPYDQIFESETTPAFLHQIPNRLRTIHHFVRSKNSTVPIILCTLPDIGATYKISDHYSDPARQVIARQRIAALNASVIVLGAELGCQIARVDHLTDRIFDQVPFEINGTIFHYPPDNANPPDRLFCHDGFHPSTVGQAVITNLILDAVNRATGSAIPLLSNREILGEVLGLNPDQPYLTWAAGAGEMNANPDGDGLPNLVEYLLDTNPNTASSPFRFSANGELSFASSPERLQFAQLEVFESQTLSNWQPVPEDRVTIAPDGTWRVDSGGVDANFYQLRATPKP